MYNSFQVTDKDQWSGGQVCSTECLDFVMTTALQLALITSPEVDLTALLRIHSIYKISCSTAD